MVFLSGQRKMADRSGLDGHSTFWRVCQMKWGVALKAFALRDHTSARDWMPM